MYIFILHVMALHISVSLVQQASGVSSGTVGQISTIGDQRHRFEIYLEMRAHGWCPLQGETP